MEIKMKMLAMEVDSLEGKTKVMHMSLVAVQRILLIRHHPGWQRRLLLI